MNPAQPLLAQARQRWQTLARREQAWVLGGATLLALLVLWRVGVAPAMQTLRARAQEQAQLDAQMQRMTELAARARQLQAQPKAAYDQSLEALEAAVQQHLGAAGQLSVVGERALVTLKACSAEALAQWLIQVRLNARLLPSEAQLDRNGAQWSGSIVLVLPART